jgi:hypothetical protein
MFVLGYMSNLALSTSWKTNSLKEKHSKLLEARMRWHGAFELRQSLIDVLYQP